MKRPHRYRLGFIAILPSLIVGCAAGPVNGEGGSHTPKVEFREAVSSGRLKIACAPVGPDASTPAWIDECNRLGKIVLSKASNRGLINHAGGTAFGRASELLESKNDELPAGDRLLVREFPLIGAEL